MAQTTHLAATSGDQRIGQRFPPTQQQQRPSTGEGSRMIPDCERVHPRLSTQQIILLMAHATIYTYPDHQGEGTTISYCPVTPHCAWMKQCLAHMSNCHDTRCRWLNCLRGRQALGHYLVCKDLCCPVCCPVRETLGVGRHNQSPIRWLSSGNRTRARMAWHYHHHQWDAIQFLLPQSRSGQGDQTRNDTTAIIELVPTLK